jgi:6-phosphogluconolactonase
VIYLGSYASGSGQGIGVAAVRDGALTLESVAECLAHPGFLAVAPGGRALYAVHELDHGLVSAFVVGDDGSLRLLGTQPSGGAQPCHLSVHPSGRYVLSANWGSGSIAVHPVDGDGALGPATAVLASPDGRFVYVGNRGHDSIGVLSTDPGLRLVATYPCGGRFPRDIALTDDGRLLLVANERADLVEVLAVNPADGSLLPTGHSLRIPRPTCVLPV